MYDIRAAGGFAWTGAEVFRVVAAPENKYFGVCTTLLGGLNNAWSNNGLNTWGVIGNAPVNDPAGCINFCSGNTRWNRHWIEIGNSIDGHNLISGCICGKCEHVNLGINSLNKYGHSNESCAPTLAKNTDAAKTNTNRGVAFFCSSIITPMELINLLNL